MATIKRLDKAFQTSDGSLFEQYEQANYHQLILNIRVFINENFSINSMATLSEVEAVLVEKATALAIIYDRYHNENVN